MKKYLCALMSIVLCACLVGCGNSEKNEEQSLVITESSIVFFETKNDADCALIKHSGRTILVDTGEKKDGKKIAEKLLDNGIDRLDMIIFSHFDKDHCGGALKIMEQISVEKIVHPQYVKDTDETEELFDFINENGIETLKISDEQSFNVGDIKLDFYPAQKTEYEKKQSNNSSLVFKVDIMGKTALFTGDCQDERLVELICYDDGMSADILKLMYHGRAVWCEEKLLDLVDPAYTVITAKKSKETKKNIEHIASMLGEYYYSTECDIVFDLSGDEIVVNV